MTALHTAASHGCVQVCKLLLDAESDLRCFDEEAMTPLHFAAMEGHLGKLYIIYYCFLSYVSSIIFILNITIFTNG